MKLLNDFKNSDYYLDTKGVILECLADIGDSFMAVCAQSRNFNFFGFVSVYLPYFAVMCILLNIAVVVFVSILILFSGLIYVFYRPLCIADTLIGCMGNILGRFFSAIFLKKSYYEDKLDK